MPAARAVGECQAVPTFTIGSISRAGAQLYPRSIATATPQTFAVASRRAEHDPTRSFPFPSTSPKSGNALHSSPYPPDLSWSTDEGASHTGSSPTPPDCLPDPSRPVIAARPGVVGAASHPHRRLPAQAAPSFIGLLRQPQGAGLSPPLDPTAPRGAPIMPSTDKGNRAARHSGSPWRNASSYMWATTAMPASINTAAMVTVRDQLEDSITITSFV